MKPRTPTRWQKLIASYTLVRAYSYSLAIATAVASVLAIGGWRYFGSSLWLALMVIVVAGIAYCAGWCFSVPTSWVLFGPIYLAQEEENGGPFKTGDMVQVISKGKFRDQIGEVYGFGQYDRPRVQLGKEAQDCCEDIFEPAQLLLIKRGNGNAG